MTPELKERIIVRYTGWAEAWGISLAFSVTQSVEKAERIVADAIVALVATERESQKNTQLPPSVTAVRFASVVWEMANAAAYRGFGADTFFRMPAITRAAVILKLRAQLSRLQIAAALHLKEKQVDDHLENARLLFSEGRSWLGLSPDLNVQGNRVTPECPQWAAEEPLQDIFAQYVGNDLDVEAGQKLQSHLVVCNMCRTGFSNFKRQYVDWAGSVPSVDMDKDLRKHLQKVTKMALKITAAPRKGPPSPWPGLKSMFTDVQTRAFLLGLGLALLFLQVFLFRHG